MSTLRRRLGGVAAVIFVLTVFAGCAKPTEPSPTPDGWTHHADAELGFSIELPPTWEALEAEDPGWVDVYGQEESVWQRFVRDGTLALFAVPLRPRGDDVSLVLAIYPVEPEEGETLDVLADRYVSDLDSMPEYSRIVKRSVDLPAGEARSIVAARDVDGNLPVQLQFWYVMTPERAWLINLNSALSNAARFEPDFLRIVRSFDTG